MNFNLNLAPSNYNSAQFSSNLNKILGTNGNNSQQQQQRFQMASSNTSSGAHQVNNNGGSSSSSSSSNSSISGNSLMNLGLTSTNGNNGTTNAGGGGSSNSNSNNVGYLLHRNSYGLSSTATSSGASSSSSSLSTSLTNLNTFNPASGSSGSTTANNPSSSSSAAASSQSCSNAASNGAASASLIASVVAAAAAAENNVSSSCYGNLLASTNAVLPHLQPPSSTCSLNNTLFVGNLHASLQEIDLIQVFRPFGHIVECCKKWLHFGFVKFTTEEEACHAYVTLNGFRLKGRPMRLEFQNRTKKARIKAILAQAALQSFSTGNVVNGSVINANGNFSIRNNNNNNNNNNINNNNSSNSNNNGSNDGGMSLSIESTLASLQSYPQNYFNVVAAAAAAASVDDRQSHGNQQQCHGNQQYQSQQQQQYQNHHQNHNQNHHNHQQQHPNQHHLHQNQHQNQHHQQQQHYGPSSYMNGGGGGGGAQTNMHGNSSGCVFSNAATNSLLESLYKGVAETSSSSSSSVAGSSGNGGALSYPYENSFFNPEQLIKFASNSEQLEQQQKELVSCGKLMLNDFNNLDYFGTTNLPRNNGIVGSVRTNGQSSNFFDLSSVIVDKEKQITNNLNSIINDSKDGGECVKRTQLSPALSPHNDCSSSLSSDSGCRSTSFLNDEDSGLSSLAINGKSSINFLSVGNGSGGGGLLVATNKCDQQQQQQQQQRQQQHDQQDNKCESDECATLSEHLEFTEACQSNSSPVKLKERAAAVAAAAGLTLGAKTGEIHIKINDFSEDKEDEEQRRFSDDENEEDDAVSVSASDTSNDASEMPADADCLNDLENMDAEQFLINSTANAHQHQRLGDEESDETKPNVGIYQSVNQSSSLFIEPNDVLKPMKSSEYNEYCLFPNGIDSQMMQQLVASYNASNQQQQQQSSNGNYFFF